MKSESNIFRLLRLARNLTVKDLAERLELTTAYVHAIENGSRYPASRTIRDYSVVFDVPRELIETFNEDKAKQNGFEKTMLWLLRVICSNDYEEQP